MGKIQWEDCFQSIKLKSNFTKQNPLLENALIVTSFAWPAMMMMMMVMMLPLCNQQECRSWAWFQGWRTRRAVMALNIHLL